MIRQPSASPILPSPPRSRFRSGVALTLLGAVFNQGSTFAFSIVAANLLGRQIFGQYALVQTMVISLAQVVQFALPYTITKYVAEFRASDPDRTGRILGMLSVVSVVLAGITTLILLFFAPWIARSILKTASLSTGLALSSAILLGTSLNGFLMAALMGLESYRSLARAQIASGMLYLVICTAMARWWGLNGAIAGLGLSALLQTVLLVRALLQECSLQEIEARFDGFVQEGAVILRFTLPAGLIGSSSAASLWLATVFLARQADGFSQMAIYSASFSLMAVVLFLPNIANMVGMSIINFHKGTGNQAEYQQIFWSNLWVTALIILCGVTLCTLYGPALLRLFGKSFKEGYTVLRILLVCTVPQGLALALGQIVQCQVKLWRFLFAVALPRDLVIVFLAYLLIPRFGATGLAIALTSAWTIALLATAFIVYQLGVDLAPRTRQVIKNAA